MYRAPEDTEDTLRHYRNPTSVYISRAGTKISLRLENILKQLWIPTAVEDGGWGFGVQSSISSVLSPWHLCLALTHRLGVAADKLWHLYLSRSVLQSLCDTMRQSARRLDDTSPSSLFPLSRPSSAVSHPPTVMPCSMSPSISVFTDPPWKGTFGVKIEHKFWGWEHPLLPCWENSQIIL